MARTRGVGLFSCFGCSLPLPACPGKNAFSYEFGLDMTYNSATPRSLSTGISIPARQLQQHGVFRLPRSSSGNYYLKLGAGCAWKPRAGARVS